MTTPFFSATEMASLQGLIAPSLNDNVTIQHRSVSQNAYGDDIVTYTTGLTVKGWLYSTPTPLQEEDWGGLVTANTYRLFVPVGTTIHPGDQVVINSQTFLVSDTTYESTWNVLIRCSLRRRE